MQSRTVGARIASILRERATEDALNAAAAADTHHNKRRHKKKLYRVVIHSSPFLRCVQTSIAISAGLASTPFPSATVATTEGISSGAAPSPADQRSLLHHNPTSSHGKLTVSTNVQPPSPATASPDLSKSVLRLDSFLGEWLSPDYFEHITPPPRSMLMLATAKAELLRRENHNEFPKFVPFSARHSPNASGRLWSAGSGSVARHSHSASPHIASPHLSSGLDNLSGLNDHLHTQTGDAQDYLHHPASGHRGYMSPVPSYAISTSQPIPQGYVAHARDACVDLDYQWDSTRDHLGWGDGGVLPEEWASMHQRFRKGLRRLIDWYTISPNPAEMVTKTPTSAGSRSTKVITEESDDVVIENVVILVSHGAGCNALVGAITQQPVLADVPMSSITMAQRRPEFDEDDAAVKMGFSSLEDALSRKRLNLSDMFELKLFANTDHLLSSIPRNMAVGRSASLTGPHGSSGGLFSGAYKSPSRDIDSAYGSSPGTRSHSTNASLGSIRRSPQGASPGLRPVNYTGSNLSSGVTVGGGATSLLSHRPVRSGSMGLWQPPKQEHELETEAVGAPVFSDDQDSPAPQEPGVPIIHTKIPEQPGSSNDDPAPRGAPPRQKTEDEKEQQQQQHEAKAEEEDRFDEATPHLWAGTGNGGLWGAPRPPGEAERLRDFSSTKRRWTVNER